MEALWVALIAAGAAILSSALTSVLTHGLERRGRRREYELKWLEERFAPALSFLGRVSAVTANAPNTQEGRDQMAERIQNVVAGPSNEDNAWCIAVLLDPENTGLRDHVLSALAYARIAESAERFNDYRVQLSMSLESLAEEFRRERQAILAGKSLEALIGERKAEIDKASRKLQQALRALGVFLDGQAKLDTTLAKIEASGIRGTMLNLMLGSRRAHDQEGAARLEELVRGCRERGWLSDAWGCPE